MGSRLALPVALLLLFLSLLPVGGEGRIEADFEAAGTHAASSTTPVEGETDMLAMMQISTQLHTDKGQLEAERRTTAGRGALFAPTVLSTETGGNVTVLLKTAGALDQAGHVHCWLAPAGAQKLQRRHLAGFWASPGRVSCSLPPLAPEGRWDLTVALSAGEFPALTETEATKVQLLYVAPLSASFSMRPYFAESEGELLVRTRVARIGNGSVRPLRLLAQLPVGEGVMTLLDTRVASEGRFSLRVPFKSLNTTLDSQVSVVLTDDTGTQLGQQSVSLVRVPQRLRGRSAVDHKRRALQVDGRPFFPISWFSTYLSYGSEALIRSLHEMAHRGANSVMIYNLIDPPRAIHYVERGPPNSGHVLDAAAAFGMKVHIYLHDIVSELANGKSANWDALDNAVLAWRHHPAVLSWYVADDNAGEQLPNVYRRIKSLDPHHLVSASVYDVSLAAEKRFLTGTDIVFVENYAGDPATVYKSMEAISRWPTEFMPAITAGRAWALTDGAARITPLMFRSHFYASLASGGTGEIWFAYRNAEAWNAPGMALEEAAAELTREVLDLVPSLLTAGDFDSATAMPAVTVEARLTGKLNASEADGVRARAFREPSGCVTLLVTSINPEPVRVRVQFPYGSPGIFDELTNMSKATLPFEKAIPNKRVPVHQGWLRDWIPPLGSQVYRLSGTGECVADVQATLPSFIGMDAKANVMQNPSFEESFAFVSAPDMWECSMSPRPGGAASGSCYADTHVQKHGRHAGRFVTGTNPFTYRITPSYKLPVSSGHYTGSIWAQADTPVSLQAMRIWSTFIYARPNAEYTTWSMSPEQEMARTQLSNTWRQLVFNITLSPGADLVFKVSGPGVVWLDAAELYLLEACPEEVFEGAKEEDA